MSQLRRRARVPVSRARRRRRCRARVRALMLLAKDPAAEAGATCGRGSAAGAPETTGLGSDVTALSPGAAMVAFSAAGAVAAAGCAVPDGRSHSYDGGGSDDRGERERYRPARPTGLRVLRRRQLAHRRRRLLQGGRFERLARRSRRQRTENLVGIETDEPRVAANEAANESPAGKMRCNRLPRARAPAAARASTAAPPRRSTGPTPHARRRAARRPSRPAGGGLPSRHRDDGAVTRKAPW